MLYNFRLKTAKISYGYIKCGEKNGMRKKDTCSAFYRLTTFYV